jgi:hypothetical protein
MKTHIGFIKKSDLAPEGRDICGECRDNGLNMCELDEICQVRLAEALGKDQMEIITSIDYAAKKGLLDVRLAKVKGAPIKFVKLSEGGRLFFASK